MSLSRHKFTALKAFLEILFRLFTRRREMVAFCQSRFRPYIFPDIDFRELVQFKPVSLHLNFSGDAYGDISPLELLIISSLVSHFKPQRIFEFGTFRGKTTYHLAANSSELTKIFTLDLPEENFKETIRQIPYDAKLLQEGRRREVGYFYKNSPWKYRITQIFCDAKEFDEGTYLNSMDMVFVDADHTYDSVVNDTRKAFAMLKKGESHKILLWHDLRQGNDVEKGIKDVGGSKGIFHIKDTMFAIYLS